MKSIAVVIPAYNEKENILRLVQSIRKKLNCTIVIVDDSSDLITKKIIKKSKIKNLLYFNRGKKSGRGSAVLFGLKKILASKKKVDCLIEMDADFSHSFEDLLKILQSSSSADVVIGSRYIEDGGSVGWDVRRKMLSSFANKLSKFLLKTKINDMTSGFRCYSNKALSAIRYETTKSDGYAFQVEMSARAVQKQLSIKEVPIIFNERRLGKSKMSKKKKNLKQLQIK